MKKLFTAVPMKKLLLATSLVAMSSTAIAANTSSDLDTAVTDSLIVVAKYVTPITIGLDTTKIDFGDVYTDSAIDVEGVVASVAGEAGETFTWEIQASSIILLTDGAEASIGNTRYTGTSFGSETDTGIDIAFNVGLDTSEVTTSDVSETITFEVVYDAIADTVVTPT